MLTESVWASVALLRNPLPWVPQRLPIPGRASGSTPPVLAVLPGVFDCQKGAHMRGLA